jgi:hypothetical protein
LSASRERPRKGHLLIFGLLNKARKLQRFGKLRGSIDMMQQALGRIEARDCVAFLVACSCRASRPSIGVSLRSRAPKDVCQGIALAEDLA